MRSMATQSTPFGVRMSPELLALLSAEARMADRSLNKEIVRRLELSIESPAPKGAEESRREGREQGLATAERTLLDLFAILDKEQQSAIMLVLRSLAEPHMQRLHESEGPGYSVTVLGKNSQQRGKKSAGDTRPDK